MSKEERERGVRTAAELYHKMNLEPMPGVVMEAEYWKQSGGGGRRSGGGGGGRSGGSNRLGVKSWLQGGARDACVFLALNVIAIRSRHHDDVALLHHEPGLIFGAEPVEKAENDGLFASREPRRFARQPLATRPEVQFTRLATNKNLVYIAALDPKAHAVQCERHANAG